MSILYPVLGFEPTAFKGTSPVMDRQNENILLCKPVQNFNVIPTYGLKTLRDRIKETI